MLHRTTAAQCTVEFYTMRLRPRYTHCVLDLGSLRCASFPRPSLRITALRNSLMLRLAPWNQFRIGVWLTPQYPKAKEASQSTQKRRSSQRCAGDGFPSVALRSSPLLDLATSLHPRPRILSLFVHCVTLRSLDLHPGSLDQVLRRLDLFLHCLHCVLHFSSIGILPLA